MCRSIKTLRTQETVTDDEIRAAALQFVRKISGYREPSRRNAEAFERAVEEVAAASRSLLEALPAPQTSRGPAGERPPATSAAGSPASA